MPTYTVNYSGIDLATDQKDRLARRIAGTHNSATGADTYFAQVIFNALPRGNHYIGGRLVAEPRLFLHGQIRAGRAPAMKQTLVLGLRDALASVTGLDNSQIWVYLVELIHAQMIEYGEILPQSGKPFGLFARLLSPGLKEKLAAMKK